MPDPYAAIRGGLQELFSQASLDDWLRKLRSDMSEAVASVDEAKVLASDPDAWAAELAERAAVDPLVLLSEQLDVVDLGERQVDVSGDPYRKFSRPGPHLVTGRGVRAEVPFTGTPTLLRCWPSRRYSSGPQAAIGDGVLSLDFEWAHDRPHDVKTDVDRFLKQVGEYISWQADAITAHNRQLLEHARRVIGARRELLLKTHAQIDALGIPVRRRDDVPRTYAAESIVRRPTPVKRRSAEGSGHREIAPALEPTLVGEFYEHILDVTDSWARAMERSPGDYPSWNEEHLRDAYLIVLNTHYEGRAGGETFNKSGKTDVLIREADRNLFVAECKWWSGPADFAGSKSGGKRSALDQLLAYTTWRDVKLALIVFVSAKDIGNVLATAQNALETHPSFRSWAHKQEGLLRCFVELPGNGDSTADLGVVFVHLPR